MYRYSLKCAANPQLSYPAELPSPTPLPIRDPGHDTDDYSDHDTDDDRGHFGAIPTDPNALVSKLQKVFCLSDSQQREILATANIAGDPKRVSEVCVKYFFSFSLYFMWNSI